MSRQLAVAQHALSSVVHMFWHRWETCNILSLHLQYLVEMNSIETLDEVAHPLYYQPVRVWVDHNLLDIRCVSFISLLIIIPLPIIVIHPIVAVVDIPIIAVAMIPVVGTIMIRSTSLSATELVVVIDIVIIITSSSPPEVCEASLCTSEFIPSVPILVGRVIEVGFRLPLVQEVQT